MAWKALHDSSLPASSWFKEKGGRRELSSVWDRGNVKDRVRAMIIIIST